MRGAVRGMSEVDGGQVLGNVLTPSGLRLERVCLDLHKYTLRHFSYTRALAAAAESPHRI